MIKAQIGDSTTVGSWLDSLDKSQKDAFVHYAKNSVSDIEAFLYARFLKPAYEGSISDLTAWVQEKYPKEDLRKILLIEIDSLKTDLHNVRQMTDGVDRRGLLLAGADRCLRELLNTFEDVPTVFSLLEDASGVIWSTIEREEKS